VSPKKPKAIVSTLAGKRVDSLPDLAHLSLRATTPDVGSLVVPQPRKALVSPKIILSTMQASPFDVAFNDIMDTEEPSARREALSELMEILCASRLGGWNGSCDSETESPQLQRSPEHDAMDVPSLSNSPAFFKVDSPDCFDDDELRGSDSFDLFGTPPSRAQNPLALSCHFANIEQGAELDLFRPSPPIYERADSYISRLNWN
jgi:hypothetical protein